MEFEELFAKALQGRKLQEAAKDWGIPYTNVQRYSKATRVPDYQTALILARDAQVNPGEVMAILARLEARKKPRSLFPDLGFATAALMISVNLFLSPPPAEAAPAVKASIARLYIMLNQLRKLRLKMHTRNRFTLPSTAR